ncbi:MAG TPA: hypothetical protein VK563_01380 [Puia sp.]|nr:hypothetical protein [Puia sp.]
MNFNIVTAVQERMGLTAFRKIDPNDASNTAALSDDKGYYEQSAALAVLAGLYRYGSDPEGALALTQPDRDTLLSTILHGRESRIARTVSSIGAHSYESTLNFMKRVAVNAQDILHEQALGNNAGGAAAGSNVVNPAVNNETSTIQHILVSQRHNILTYLPPEMQVGKVLKDNAMDDRTNKMEGPVSDLMHFFENIFASEK